LLENDIVHQQKYRVIEFCFSVLECVVGSNDLTGIKVMFSSYSVNIS